MVAVLLLLTSSHGSYVSAKSRLSVSIVAFSAEYVKYSRLREILIAHEIPGILCLVAIALFIWNVLHILVAGFVEAG